MMTNFTYIVIKEKKKTLNEMPMCTKRDKLDVFYII